MYVNTLEMHTEDDAGTTSSHFSAMYELKSSPPSGDERASGNRSIDTAANYPHRDNVMFAVS